MSAAPGARTGSTGPAWLTLYLSGGLLIAFIVAHLYALHYTAEAGTIRFESVAARIRSPLFAFIDLGLLVLSLYHGLAGARRIVLDLFVGISRRAVTAALVVLGLAGFYQGILIWRAFAGV